MRKIVLPLVFMASVVGVGSFVMVGCGGSSSNVTVTKGDMATSKPDLAEVEDFTTPAPGCDATIMCENNCQSGSGQDACVQACDKAESKEGANLENAAVQCAYAHCGAVPDTMDAGAGACEYNPTTQDFDDPSGCNKCINEQIGTGGPCATQWQACLADTSGE